MIDFPISKKTINLADKEVIIYDLSVGFLIDFEAKQVKDDFSSILNDATSLSEEQIRSLRKSEAEFLIKEIMILTYGEIDQNAKSVEDGEEKKQ